MSNRISRRGTIIEQDGISYQTGFGNTFESECVSGALPAGRNNPRLVPFRLYTEQLSGTAFTAPRAENRRVWLYRIQPSVVVSAAEDTGRFFGGIAPSECQAQVDPLRWKPASMEQGNQQTFLTGMKLMCAAGDPVTKNGLAIYQYICGNSMNDTSFYNSDGDFLIVPQQGELRIQTEVGRFRVHPNEIIVIPRGFGFNVDLNSDSRGYVLEVYNGGFQLPELGPIGSNGLANARDFYYPTAHCVSSKEDYRRPSTIYCKMHSKLYMKQSDHSPFNVVAWHGNYLPYKCTFILKS
jgi:homogentisate 1,2-dioxygenase